MPPSIMIKRIFAPPASSSSSSELSRSGSRRARPSIFSDSRKFWWFLCGCAGDDALGDIIVPPIHAIRDAPKRLDAPVEPKKKSITFRGSLKNEGPSTARGSSARPSGPDDAASRRESIKHGDSTSERTGGRILRVVVVGACDSKMSAVLSRPPEEEKHGHRSTIKSEVSVLDAFTSVIFNDCPARDLENALVTSDYEDYVSYASGAIIVADSAEEHWAETASKWRRRVVDEKKIPVALLVRCRGRGEIEAGEEEFFGPLAETPGRRKAPFVGVFVTVSTSESIVDEAPACLDALIKKIREEASRGQLRAQSRRSASMTPRMMRSSTTTNPVRQDRTMVEHFPSRGFSQANV